ncbi:MAG: ABC transporter permease [Chloroflexota bacterium]|nr:ABC transporter permease [Chloroflexota bacterium]
MTANPVLLQELRVRMRGATAYALLAAIILVFGAFTLATYWSIANRIRPVAVQFGSFADPSNQGPQIDRLLVAQRGPIFFLVMALWAIVLVAFIVPASTSGTISRERELKTLPLLQVTPLRPLTLVTGKLLGAVSYVLLLLAAAIPLFSIVIMFGGIALDQAINVVLVVAAATFGFGALGVFLSAAARNSLLASLLTYTAVLTITFGSYGIYALSSPLKAASLNWLLYLSPLAAILSALTQTNPQLAAVVARFFHEPGTSVVGEWWTLGHYPLWYVTVAGYLLAGLLLAVAASRIIEPLRRWL